MKTLPQIIGDHYRLSKPETFIAALFDFVPRETFIEIIELIYADVENSIDDRWQYGVWYIVAIALTLCLVSIGFIGISIYLQAGLRALSEKILEGESAARKALTVSREAVQACNNALESYDSSLGRRLDTLDQSIKRRFDDYNHAAQIRSEDDYDRVKDLYRRTQARVEELEQIVKKSAEDTQLAIKSSQRHNLDAIQDAAISIRNECRELSLGRSHPVIWQIEQKIAGVDYDLRMLTRSRGTNLSSQLPQITGPEDEYSGHSSERLLLTDYPHVSTPNTSALNDSNRRPSHEHLAPPGRHTQRDSGESTLASQSSTKEAVDQRRSDQVLLAEFDADNSGVKRQPQVDPKVVQSGPSFPIDQVAAQPAAQTGKYKIPDPQSEAEEAEELAIARLLSRKDTFKDADKQSDEVMHAPTPHDEVALPLSEPFPVESKVRTDGLFIDPKYGTYLIDFRGDPFETVTCASCVSLTESGFRDLLTPFALSNDSYKQLSEALISQVLIQEMLLLDRIERRLLLPIACLIRDIGDSINSSQLHEGQGPMTQDIVCDFVCNKIQGFSKVQVPTIQEWDDAADTFPGSRFAEDDYEGSDSDVEIITELRQPVLRERRETTPVRQSAPATTAEQIQAFTSSRSIRIAAPVGHGNRCRAENNDLAAPPNNSFDKTSSEASASSSSGDELIDSEKPEESRAEPLESHGDEIIVTPSGIEVAANEIHGSETPTSRTDMATGTESSTCQSSATPVSTDETPERSTPVPSAVSAVKVSEESNAPIAEATNVSIGEVSIAPLLVDTIGAAAALSKDHSSTATAPLIKMTDGSTEETLSVPSSEDSTRQAAEMTATPPTEPTRATTAEADSAPTTETNATQASETAPSSLEPNRSDSIDGTNPSVKPDPDPQSTSSTISSPPEVHDAADTQSRSSKSDGSIACTTPKEQQKKNKTAGDLFQSKWAPRAPEDAPKGPRSYFKR